ncbi:hypothetical protein O2U53_003769 [Vibrio vulnificus]|nr:hypothetical protein [Vibrio vulnificus]
MSRKNKSKSVFLDDDFYDQPFATVVPLHLSQLKLKCDGTTSHIEQLLYKGAPNYLPNGKKRNGVDYLPVIEREGFVRDVYGILSLDFNRTKQAIYNQLRLYVRWLDNTHRDQIDGDYFHPDLYNAYMIYHQDRCSLGKQKLGTWVSAKQMLSFFLRAKNRDNEAKLLKSIKGTKKSVKSHKGIDPTEEFKPLIRCFIAAFNRFKNSFIEKTQLEIHPFWDEERFEQTSEKEGWSSTINRGRRLAFKNAVRSENAVRNNFSRLASMLAFCFTGQNTTPLLKLRFGDLRFVSKSGGKVYFDMTKARANYLDIDTSLGFHKKTQDFFHQWLEISMELQKESGTDWVFPYFMQSGEIKSTVDAGQLTPQKKINKLTRCLGLAHITPSILRQTKIDVLMKVTQNIWLVSVSANNSVKTLAGSYSDGHDGDHKRSLAASTDAFYDTLKNGTDVHDAVNNAKFNFSDVLSDYAYKNLRKEEKENDKQTPIGTRCTDPTQGVANTVKKNLEKLGIAQPEEAICTDFLGCFECQYHRLVSEAEDIWLMLSFNQTLQEMKDYPEINSLPTDKFYKLCNTIEAILTRFKEVSPSNYSKAEEMQCEAPHPLYSDGYSLTDLLEVF